VGAADVRGTDSRLRVVGLRPAREHRCSGLGSVQVGVLRHRSVSAALCLHVSTRFVRTVLFGVTCRQQVLEMFYHAYDGYMRHGYPLDELRPLSCDGVDTWGRLVARSLICFLYQWHF
jgi:hypothetical protein